MDQFSYLPGRNGLRYLDPIHFLQTCGLRARRLIHKVSELENPGHDDVWNPGLEFGFRPVEPKDRSRGQTVGKNPATHITKDCCQHGYGDCDNWAAGIPAFSAHYKFDCLGGMDRTVNPMASVQG